MMNSASLAIAVSFVHNVFFSLQGIPAPQRFVFTQFQVWFVISYWNGSAALHDKANDICLFWATMTFSL